MSLFGNPASEVHSTGAVSMKSLAEKVAEIDSLLGQLRDDDALPARRRVIAARVSATARSFAQSVVMRSDALDRLYRLADELECMPTSMQRFDHHCSKLEWAVRRIGSAQVELLQQEAEVVQAESANDDDTVAGSDPMPLLRGGNGLVEHRA